ncbi:TPA: hypothetical protein ACS509_004811 [Salmonella enterica]
MKGRAGSAETGLPEPAEFLREVSHRTACLALSVQQMSVLSWLREPEHIRQLREMCRETVAFMVPPEAGASQAWRRTRWVEIAESRPETVKVVLLLSGGTVLRNQLTRGELYAGAVLHSLLESWLMKYDVRGGQNG